MVCSTHFGRLILSLGIASLVAIADARQSSAFGFIFAESNGVNIVAHPSGYNGTTGVLNVSVGIDTTSLDDGVSNTTLMTVAVQNVINTWNALLPTTGNVITDFVNIPVGAVDFESVLLHEMGHSLGLTHNNLGVRTGVSGFNTDFATSTDGADNSYSFGAGVDGVIGSRDDVRGDDVNLNYFRTSGTTAEQNNPFTIDAIVDSTTYSRDLGDLPAGDLYSGVSSQQNAAIFAVLDNTEAVMNQGATNNQIQRTLGHDDVAGLLYAQAGLDSVVGGLDDYTLNLTFAGLVAGGGADIVIDFDNAQTDFAVSQTFGGTVLAFGAHPDIAITTNKIFFNDGSDWFYNQTSNAAAVPEPSTFAAMSATVLFVYARRRQKNRNTKA